MVTCPSCGSHAPPQARYCPACGTALGTVPAAAPPTEERRLLTVLFADLAGFTQRSDHADPEDVRNILVPFHAIAKEEVERFGGTLDKFIGDAAVGVFGAPVTHEDDAERAVRAALSIRDRLDREGTPVRLAVSTGEALVTLGEGPAVGEHVAGDVVNTASRIQSLAPEGSVVVVEATRRVTRRTIDYEPMAAADDGGGATTPGLWIAEAVRPTALERDEDDPPPFVGRERERRHLRDLMDRATRDRVPHMLTVLGEPGIGKSRLVSDLGEHLGTDPGDIAFHRGRCLPYGEGITYAALVALVRGVLGVPPGGSRELASAALETRLPALAPQDERDWLRSRLGVLVGPTSGTEAAVDRAESFAAWARFLELAASRASLVLVVEDLHWAEPPMLEFLEHLVEQADGVGLLVICTARPELLAAHPAWGSGDPRTSTLTLPPLPDPDMLDLLSALLAGSAVPDETRASLMRRAGGNPLYAREFVHMLEDGAPAPARGAGAGPGGAAGPAITVPDTVQALIAARLDALATSHRALIQAAAVVGDRFWPGALGTLEPGVDPEEGLHELERRGLIRRSPLSTIPGQRELAFTHGLIRDVAYGRLPRATRARMHLDVTRWIEVSADEGVAERADLLASHTVRALDLARAAGAQDEIADLEPAAMRFLVLAGEHQAGLDARRAAEYYARAVTLAPGAGEERAELLRLATGLGWRAGTMSSEEAVAAYREAIEGALAAGAPVAAARAMRRLYFQLGLAGDTAGARAVLDEAIELLEAQPEPGETLAELYACRSEAGMLAGRSQESLAWANRALDLPRSLEVTLMALHLRGNARCELGDYGGVDDLREALHLSRGSDVALHTVQSYSYLVERVGLLEGPIPALEMNRAALELCDRRGLEHQSMWSRTERLWLLFDAGRWDEIEELAARLGPWSRSHGEVQVSTVTDTFAARVRCHRGDGAAAAVLIEEALPAARGIEDLQVLAPALLVAAQAAHATGDRIRTGERLLAYHEVTAGGPPEYREVNLPEAVRLALAVDDPDLAGTLVTDLAIHEPRMRNALEAAHAHLDEHAGRTERAAAAYERVAGWWSAWSMAFERAHATAGLARCHQARGRQEEARAARAEADACFASLGMDPAVRAPA